MLEAVLVIVGLVVVAGWLAIPRIHGSDDFEPGALEKLRAKERGRKQQREEFGK